MNRLKYFEQIKKLSETGNLKQQSSSTYSPNHNLTPQSKHLLYNPLVLRNHSPTYIKYFIYEILYICKIDLTYKLKMFMLIIFTKLFTKLFSTKKNILPHILPTASTVRNPDNYYTTLYFLETTP